MTNMAVEAALKQQGVEFVRAKVGDRYVLEALNARGWQIGGTKITLSVQLWCVYSRLGQPHSVQI